MMIIKIPHKYESERRYILSVIFTEFLGIDIYIKKEDIQNTIITMNEEKELIISDDLFTTSRENWLSSKSLPKTPLKIWDLATTNIDSITVNTKIPVIYGDDPSSPNFLSMDENKIYLRLDIFGSAFFMLTRYEEAVKSERDNHDRFPAKASLAYQEGFLDRPIINEYLEIIWACLKHLCPKLERKHPQFTIHLSHDVDTPFLYALMGILDLTKVVARDIIKCKSFRQAMDRIPNLLTVKRGKFELDPYNTFDMIMDISEYHNFKSSFYFITAKTSFSMDGNYSIYHPLIRSILKKIHKRGHEIGLHTSYNTYRDQVQTKKEFEILKKVCFEEQIEQEYWGVVNIFYDGKTRPHFKTGKMPDLTMIQLYLMLMPQDLDAESAMNFLPLIFILENI